MYRWGINDALPPRAVYGVPCLMSLEDGVTTTIRTLGRQPIPTAVHELDISGHIYIYISDLYDLYDLYDQYDRYDLAHVTGCEPYNLRDLGHVSWFDYIAQMLHNIS